MFENSLTKIPPQVILYERIKHTIGADPKVCIPKMECKCGVFKIYVIVKCPKKALALASILKRYYCFGHVKVEVLVIYCGKVIEPCHYKNICNEKEFVKKLFDCALGSNCYYDRAVVINHCRKHEVFGDVAVLFKKKVIQFNVCNPCDYCGNINEVAADAFSEVLINKFFCDVKVIFSTVAPCCC
ncbi:MAG: hypothetical protein AB6733_20810 [Clostridiaceae bacterium]